MNIDSRVAVRKLVLSGLRRSGIARLAAGLTEGVGAILMLHRVTDELPPPPGINRHLGITPDFLDLALSDMKREGFSFLSMDELVEQLQFPKGRSRKIAAVTLDDGYHDNLVEALPVLELHEIPFIIHVAPGLIDGTLAPWWLVLEEIVLRSDQIWLPGRAPIQCRSAREKLRADRIVTRFLTEEISEPDQPQVLAALARAAGVEIVRPHRLLLGWEELARLATHPLASLGAHTVSHFNLRRLDEDAARQEIEDAVNILADRLGARPRHMAYPYGSASAAGAREVRLAREAGFESAVTTRHGVIHPAHARHLHALPRISLNGNYQKLQYLRTMLSGISTPLANGGKRVVSV